MLHHAFALLAACALVPTLAAAAPIAEDRVALEAELVPATAAPGATVTLKLTAKIAAGQHAYAPSSPGGAPLSIQYSEKSGLEPQGDLRFPPPRKTLDPILKEQMVHLLEGTAVLEQDFKVPAAAKGSLPLRGTLVIQACDDRTCKMERHAFDVALAVGEAATSATPAPPAPENPVVPQLVPGLPGALPKAKPTDRVTVSARVEPERVKPGATAALVVTVHVLPTMHIYAPGSPSSYGVPTQLRLALPAGVTKAGEPQFPAHTVVVDEALEQTYFEYEGDTEIVVRQPLAVAAGAKGELRIDGVVEGQACDESTCSDFVVPIPVVLIADPLAADAPPVAATPPSAAPAPAPARGRPGLGAFLLQALIAGLLSLTMPCVFPMIPITVSVFTKQAAGGRSQSLYLAAVYALSIVAVFTTLGVAASVFVGSQAANQFGTNAWVNLCLALLFVVFALSLLGAFELKLPDFLVRGAADAQMKSSGVAQVVMMAVVFTLTSFTCTVAFVGTLLVQAAQGDYLWPILGMLTFSATFALPFFLLALFPTLMSSLPKAGGWMNTAKVAMGLLELAFAMKFFSNADLKWKLELLTRPNVLASWVAIGAITTLYLLGRIRTAYDDEQPSLGPTRMVMAVLCGWMTVYLSTGFVGNTFGNTIEGLLPPAEYGRHGAPVAGAGESAPRLEFLQSYAEAKKVAIAEGRPLFIDFTGLLCANCRAMEQRVFPLPEVRKELARYVRVQLWVDDGPDAEFNAEFEIKLTGSAAQPYYVMLDPRSETKLDEFEGYANNADRVADFVGRLRGVADRWDEKKVAATDKK